MQIVFVKILKGVISVFGVTCFVVMALATSVAPKHISKVNTHAHLIDNNEAIELQLNFRDSVMCGCFLINDQVTFEHSILDFSKNNKIDTLLIENFVMKKDSSRKIDFNTSLILFLKCQKDQKKYIGEYKLN